MTELHWYKKRMQDPSLSTQEYLKYWNIVQEIEFNYNTIYSKRMSELEK